jgi:hypothetical protein
VQCTNKHAIFDIHTCTHMPSFNALPHTQDPLDSPDLVLKGIDFDNSAATSTALGSFQHRLAATEGKLCVSYLLRPFGFFTTELCHTVPLNRCSNMSAVLCIGRFELGPHCVIAGHSEAH